MTTETYEILAIKYGEFTSRRRFESFITADDHDAPHPIDYFVWLIRNANRTILVDCGFDEAEGTKRGRAHRPHARRRAGDARRLAARVEQLIVSHLHYDHAGTLRRLPQRPLPSAGRGDGVRHRPLHVPQPPALSLHRRPRLRDGAQRLFRPRDLPRRRRRGGTGHHRAQGRRPQPRPAVRARDDGRPARSCSPPTARTSTRTSRRARCFPSPSTSPTCWTATTRLKALAASPRHVVPGHDPLVLQRYPALNSQTQGIAHRLDVARLDG